MSETSTNYLYVLPPQVQDRNFAASTTARDGSFDEHLNQASSSAPDENRTSSTSNQRASSDSSTGTSDQNAYNDQSSRPADSNSKPRPEKTSAAPSSPSGTTEQSAGGQRKETHVERGEKQGDAEKHEPSPVAQLGAAIHLARQAESKQPGSDSAKAKVDKDAVAVVSEPSKQASITSELPNTLVKGQSQPTKPDPKAGDEPSDSSVLNTTDQQTVDGRVAAKQTKNPKSKNTGKAKLEAAEDDALQGGSSDHSDDEKVQAETGQNANRVSTVTVTDVKGNREVAPEDQSSDDARHVSGKDAKAGPTAPTADHINKVDVAQVVNAATVATNETIVGAAAKDDKDERAVKPVSGPNESAAASFARLTRTGAAISRETGAKGADGLPQVDITRFVGRVTKAFQTAHERGGSLQIRLSPPELGALRLELTVKDGVMSASLQTENSSARRLLLDHLPILRDRLAEQNIQVDRFDVDVRREGTGGQADARGSQHQQFQDQPERPSPRRQFASAQKVREPVALQAEVVPNVSDAGLNLII